MKITNSCLHKFFVVSIFLLPLSSLLYPLTCIYAEDIDITTYYPSPFGAYKQLQIQELDESTALTDFTQSIDRAGIHVIIGDDSDGKFVPGIYWSTMNDNPSKPKAGIMVRPHPIQGWLAFWLSSTYSLGLSSGGGFMVRENGGVGIDRFDPAPQELLINGKLRLPLTEVDTGPNMATAGIIFSGPDRFIHGFGTHNAFLGIESGNLTMISLGENTGVGYRALYANTSGAYNVAFGSQALSSNTSGSYNTAIGAEALIDNQDGSYNTALGYWALYENISGSYNSAAGAYALRDNTTGANNTAMGESALQSNISGSSNTAIGYNALHDSNADFNTAFGADALKMVTTNGSNTAVGAGAGQNATGSGNIFIGYQAGQNEAGSDKLYIDNNNIALGATTGPLIYGDFANDLVQIMGATAAQGKLSIGRTPNATYRLSLPTTASPAGRGIAKGTLVEGTTTAYAWMIYSSIRWKENITPIPNALKKVKKLRGVTYTRKDSKTKEIGMIAEEVGKIFPEIVDYEKNGTDAIGMSYDRLVAVLVEAAKELKAKNESLKKRIESLENRASIR